MEFRRGMRWEGVLMNSPVGFFRGPIGDDDGSGQGTVMFDYTAITINRFIIV